MVPQNLAPGDVVQIVASASSAPGLRGFDRCYMEVLALVEGGVEGFIGIPGLRGVQQDHAYCRAGWSELVYVGRPEHPAETPAS